MARRRIGQENFGFSSQSGSARTSSLDELSGLIDWTPVDTALKSIHNAAKGEAAVQIRLAAIAYNLKRSFTILRVQGA